MIRSKIQKLADADPPNWLSRHLPDGVWRWAFGVTADEALMQMAYAELLARPGITVYEFYDGEEFNRRSAGGPLADLQRSMERVVEGMAAMGESVKAVFASFQRATSGLQSGDRRRDDAND